MLRMANTRKDSSVVVLPSHLSFQNEISPRVHMIRIDISFRIKTSIRNEKRNELNPEQNRNEIDLCLCKLG